jgi:hypothetical protein
MENDAGGQCLTGASVRESNVNALKASLLAFPTLFTFSSPSIGDNGILNKSCSRQNSGTGLQLRDSP